MKYKNCEGIKNCLQDRCLWGVKCKRITIGKDPRNRCHGAMHCLPTQIRACKIPSFSESVSQIPSSICKYIHRLSGDPRQQNKGEQPA
jgi:hypothetical protein